MNLMIFFADNLIQIQNRKGKIFQINKTKIYKTSFRINEINLIDNSNLKKIKISLKFQIIHSYKITNLTRITIKIFESHRDFLNKTSTILIIIMGFNQE